MKIFRINFIVILFCTFSLFAQIDLEINNNMLVETSGGLYLEVSGDVIENGTGYLKGVVTSGNRTSETTFAGLTLSSGFTGTITRTTGSAFSSSSPKTTLRSYKMDNSGSALTTNVDAEIITSVTNNEENGITDKFIYVDDGVNWTGYTDNGSTENIVKAANVEIPTGVSNIVISEGVGVAATVFLQGSYNTSTNNMNNSINSEIPLLSPFVQASRTTSAIPSNAVDWVLVELRSGTAASTTLGYRSAFIDANGNIINDNGSQIIGLPTLPGSYYLVIKHRNHLSVMSSNTIAFDWVSNP